MSTGHPRWLQWNSSDAHPKTITRSEWGSSMRKDLFCRQRSLLMSWRLVRCFNHNILQQETHIWVLILLHNHKGGGCSWLISLTIPPQTPHEACCSYGPLIPSTAFSGDKRWFSKIRRKRMIYLCRVKAGGTQLIALPCLRASQHYCWYMHDLIIPITPQFLDVHFNAHTEFGCVQSIPLMAETLVLIFPP